MKALKTTVAALALLAGAAGHPVLANSMFDQGLQDRTAWEQWFNSLQGDYKTGAFYWAGQRSLPHPGSCQQMDADFYRGCTDAKVKLATTDALRKTEPGYKVSWNSYVANVAPIAAPEMASTPTPAPQVASASAPQVTVNVQAPAPQVDGSYAANHQGERAENDPPAGAMPEPAPQPAVRWYVGHMGPGTCVPLADIDLDAPVGSNRLYYGTGSLRTPSDFAHWFTAHGTVMQRKTFSNDDVVMYVSQFPGGKEIGFGFFTDKSICQQAMAALEADK